MPILAELAGTLRVFGGRILVLNEDPGHFDFPTQSPQAAQMDRVELL